MSNNQRLTLAISSGTTFLASLAVYTAASGRVPTARLAYSAFVCGIAALATWIVLRKANIQWWGVAIVYMAIIALVTSIQGALR